MRASDIKPGQRFTLPTDPHDGQHTLTKVLTPGGGCYAMNASHEIVPVHPDSSCELVEGGEGQRLAFTITHHENERAISGRVEIRGAGIDIFFDGFGTHDMQPGHGSPVFIETDASGNPIVYCWSEIDSEDFTHKISLHGARDNRTPE